MVYRRWMWKSSEAQWVINEKQLITRCLQMYEKKGFFLKCRLIKWDYAFFPSVSLCYSLRPPLWKTFFGLTRPCGTNFAERQPEGSNFSCLDKRQKHQNVVEHSLAPHQSQINNRTRRSCFGVFSAVGGEKWKIWWKFVDVSGESLEFLVGDSRRSSSLESEMVSWLSSRSLGH